MRCVCVCVCVCVQVETVPGRATLANRFAGYASAASLSSDPTTWYDFMSDMASFIESAAGYNYPVILQCVPLRRNEFIVY